ncbi:MAG: MBL fold metallo-hydrolase [Erysipelotrichaceae bacterium]|nr:MBL fold metallo-hydrolase [Erysipelotrichaceae bacterium]MBR4122340.1 MBL fold metallo-hydrolase [Erysipelotrichaceae bacterium]
MGSVNLREDIDYPTDADLLILPYDGWENNFPPAVRVIERLRPKRILLDHYDDTIPPITMPLDLDSLLERFRGKVKAMELFKAEEV